MHIYKFKISFLFSDFTLVCIKKDELQVHHKIFVHSKIYLCCKEVIKE